MSAPAHSCRTDTDLAAVARIMWESDCGVVPVTDESGRIIGVVTDRDICIASATRRMLPEQLRAEDVMTKSVATCGPDDGISELLATMKERKVRRVPIVDAEGRLQGIVSMNDIVLAADGIRRPTAGQIVETLAAICEHRPVALQAVA
jgi:CBS domain-containing protein